ncbi:hypothetical protein ACWDR0_27700 [Streptomyces sp. NPDC003691]
MEALRKARRIAVLLTVLALGLVLAPAAVAGGPTSVMIIEHPQGRAVALRMESTEYRDLEKLMSAGSVPQGGGEPPAGVDPDQSSRASVRMTWFLHDVLAWRTDQVYFGKAPKDVWINSRVNGNETASASGGPGTGDNWLSSEGVWHRPADGPGLRKLLRTLGLGPDSGAAAAADRAPVPADPPVAAVAPSAALTAASPPSPGIGENWWWSLPGLVAGTAIALLLRSAIARSQSALPGGLPGRRGPERE